MLVVMLMDDHHHLLLIQGIIIIIIIIIIIFIISGAGLKLHSIIEGIRALSPIKYQTLIVWGDSNSSSNTKFSLRLVEDSIYGIHSYVDFLCNIHSKVQGRYS